MHVPSTSPVRLHFFPVTRSDRCCRGWVVTRRALCAPGFGWCAHRKICRLRLSQKLSCCVEGRPCSTFRKSSQQRRRCADATTGRRLRGRGVVGRNTFDCIHPCCQTRTDYVLERAGRLAGYRGWFVCGLSSFPGDCRRLPSLLY